MMLKPRKLVWYCDNAKNTIWPATLEGVQQREAIIYIDDNTGWCNPYKVPSIAVKDDIQEAVKFLKNRNGDREVQIARTNGKEWMFETA